MCDCLKICGVVVLYNPLNDVLDAIKTYISIVDKLFVIDNSEIKNLFLLEELKKNKNVRVIDMGGNEGIAAALNKGLSFAVEEEFNYCLTMDQDSFFPTEKFEIIKKYLVLKDIDEYGIIGLNINSNIEKEELIECKTIITSGNFINLKNYCRIKGFTSELFIDYVDFDLNEQFHSINKKIAYINNVSLIHTIGTPIKKKIFWKTFYCMNHSPVRYYYRYRNSLYLYKKNKSFYRERYWHDLINDVIKVLLFEPNKIKKMKMINRGRKDAKKGILGKYKEIE